MVHGLVLAAGAGRRMGFPKALARDPDGTSWLARSVSGLLDGGCDDVTVVLGAAHAEARGLVPADADVVVAGDWAEGMGASLRAGLNILTSTSQPAVVVTLVDLPDVGAHVVRRLLDRQVAESSLVRASYGGTPGHPVLLGRDHWAGVLATAHGDQGARVYLAGRDVALVECGDLASGRDLDSQEPDPNGGRPGAG